MSNIERKIIISADGGQFSSAIKGISNDVDSFSSDAARQLGEISLDSVLEQSDKWSESIKERLKLLESEKSKLGEILNNSGSGTGGGENPPNGGNGFGGSSKLEVLLDDEQYKLLLSTISKGGTGGGEGDNKPTEDDTQNTPKGLLSSLRNQAAELRGQREEATSKGKIAKINSKLDRVNKQYLEAISSKTGSQRAVESTKNFGSSATRNVLSALGLSSLFTIGGILTKGISEGKEVDESRGKLFGLSDRSQRRELGFGRDFGYRTAENYGVKQSEFFGMAANLGKASGSSQDLESRTLSNIQLERALGMNLGDLTASSGLRRSETDQTSVSENVLEMLNIFRKTGLFGIDKGDFTQVQEKLDFANQLNRTQSQQFENVDFSVSNQILAVMGQLGGSFSDQRQLQQTSTINDSLRNPKNDFVRALQFRSLQETMPEGSSLFEVLEGQEKGIFQKDYLKQFLTNLQKSSGSQDDNFFLNISDSLGLSKSSSRKLGEGFMGNEDFRTSLSNIGSLDELKKMLADDKGAFTQEGFAGNAYENTGNISRLLANVNSEFGFFGEKGIDYFAEKISVVQQQGVSEGLGQIGKDLTDQIGKGFDELISTISTKLEVKLDELIKKNSDKLNPLNWFKENDSEK